MTAGMPGTVPGVPSKFPYKVDPRYLPILLLYGFRPRRNAVQLDDEGGFLATFGLIRLGTTRRNIEGAHITRGYRWWTAVGARLSLVDDGLSFGTNREAGVCIHFRERVPSRIRKAGHSALTVTVEDLDGLVAELGPADPR